jgi:hypothetical protein
MSRRARQRRDKRAESAELQRTGWPMRVSQCASNDSPWLVCKPCNAAGQCKRLADEATQEIEAGDADAR